MPVLLSSRVSIFQFYIYFCKHHFYTVAGPIRIHCRILCMDCLKNSPIVILQHVKPKKNHVNIKVQQIPHDPRVLCDSHCKCRNT